MHHSSAQKICFLIILTNLSIEILHSLFPLSFFTNFSEIHTSLHLHFTRSAMNLILPNTALIIILIFHNSSAAMTYLTTLFQGCSYPR